MLGLASRVCTGNLEQQTREPTIPIGTRTKR